MINKQILRCRIYKVIFEADTPAGKLFDVILLIVIVVSVGLIILDSVQSYQIKYRVFFKVAEWLITGLFTIEYAFRIYSAPDRRRYLFSFFGIVDLLAIFPTYLALFVAGTHYLIVIRALRLLRLFRIFRLSEYVSEGSTIIRALKCSYPKILVFMFFIVILVIVLGATMYVIEGSVNPTMDNIPQCIYWAIVTLTTVGYGDITPVTLLGRFLSMVIMLLGYSIIAVPTGILSAEMVKSAKNEVKHCTNCNYKNNDKDAKFCKKCGHPFFPRK